MISTALELCLQKVFVTARRDRHEYVTVEHLLLAVLDEESAKAVLLAHGADTDALRSSLARHIAEHTPVSRDDQAIDTQPTLGFQRVIQQAILHVRASGKKEVRGADVLRQVCRERDSHARYFLSQAGVDVSKVTGLASSSPVKDAAAADEQNEIDAEATRQIVLLHDDRTPPDFAVAVLEEFLLLDPEDAAEVVQEAQREGKAVCGLFPRETAEFLLQQIAAFARKRGYPLRCVAAVQK